MKISRYALVALALMILACAPLAAQTTYDLSQHFMLKPGQWKIREGTSLTGGTGTSKEGLVVTAAGKYVIQNWFDFDGKNWSLSGQDIFEVTPTHLILHGTLDPFTGPELFDPPLNIPRALQLNQPSMKSGVLRSGKGAVPYVFTFVITAAGITKTVKGGTFTSCIQTRMTFIEGDEIESLSEIMAPAVGPVYSVDSELDESNPAQPRVDGSVWQLVQK